MPGARQPPGEANSGFRLCKHTTFSQLTGLSLRPEHTLTCTGVTARILSLPPSLSHHLTHWCATAPTTKRPNTCAFVLWCDKLKGSKSPEKAFSSSWVTQVQVAPSRLINSSNESWIFNTYSWNRASTLAPLFHMRTLQIAQFWDFFLLL